jgi:DNA-binding PadR family transcriptional regulator
MIVGPTRLLVLGVVRESGGPVHGYDVRRKLLARGATSWANIAPGSIYNALKTLVREGFLENVGTDRQGARPERTCFRLTAAGEEEYTRLLRENLREARLPNHPLLAGLAFLPEVPPGELVETLHHRAAALRAQAADTRNMAANIRAGEPGGIPPHVAESYDLVATLREAEATWATSLANRLTRDGCQSCPPEVRRLPTRAPAPGNAPTPGDVAPSGDLATPGNVPIPGEVAAPGDPATLGNPAAPGNPAAAPGNMAPSGKKPSPGKKSIPNE